MSETMLPASYERLLSLICREYEQSGAILGVRHVWKAKRKALAIFGDGRIETPIGPAAGPHTRTARGIIAAYAAGARYFELGPVVPDADADPRPRAAGTPFPRPGGVSAARAAEEYITAWRILKVISEKYGLGAPDGFVFNIALGYTLADITSPDVTAFLDAAADAGMPRAATVCALPGSPADETERMANWLMADRGLNTFVKCSPALLGYDLCRRGLDRQGHDAVALDETAFTTPWPEAAAMFRRLRSLAKHEGLVFGLRVADALPVLSMAGGADRQYLSGRALYPLACRLASLAAEEFGGRLPVSFSGGADCRSVEGLFEAGLWPVTMTDELLRPGGYERLGQLAELLYRKDYTPYEGVDVKKTAALAAGAADDPWYKAPLKPAPDGKVSGVPPLLDCFTAPCRAGCPLGQDIPAYIRLCGKGRYPEALRLITRRDPLPNITGHICTHRCAESCVRRHYEAPVDIRGCALEATNAAYFDLLRGIRVPPRNGQRAAVVGAGPAGIAAAHFLAREGFNVTVFDSAPQAGGAVRRVIPAFRIDDRAIDRDVALAQAYGVNFCFGCAVRSLDELRGFDHIVLCIGAGIPGPLPLEEGQARNALEFLSAFKRHPRLTRLGRNVVVAGGGSTAMDTARAARRVFGVRNVTVVYRRDMRSMPADEAALQAALSDGVKLSTLLTPVAWNGKTLRCEVMELGPADDTGRRTVVPTGNYEYLPADSLLAAVGEAPDMELYREMGLPMDEAGRVIYDPATGRTGLENVYLAGDGATGPASVADAIAGAARVAEAICGTRFSHEPESVLPDPAGALAKKGVLRETGHASDLCLECAAVCENCVDVCPARANIAVDVEGRSQILHLDALCTRCGNCRRFCPWSGAPREDKWTLFSDEASFEKSENQGFVALGGLSVRARFGGRVFAADLGDSNGGLPDALAILTRAVLTGCPDLAGTAGPQSPYIVRKEE